MLLLFFPGLNTDGPIIEGEEEQKSMATLLKRTKLSRYASNISDMLFMVIVMASPRGFSDFILEAEKYAKTCPKMCFSGLKQKFRNCHNLKTFEGISEWKCKH